MRIVFMGTPEFAVPSLRILVENGFNVVGVITAPDRPKGRGKKLATSAVKDYALDAGLNILQPTNLKNPEFQQTLRDLKADLQVVVAFRMLPEAVWDMPPIGTFNLHGSLLPQYRGAAPINWAIINGEKETGITTFFLKHEIDTGEIIFQKKEPIAYEDNVGTVYIRLMQKGAELVLKTAQAIANGEYPSVPQVVPEDLKHAPKIFRETCEIDWSKSAEAVRNHIRGLSPYPAAWTTFQGKNLKVFASELVDSKLKTNIGDIQSDWKTYLHVRTGDGVLSLTDVQLEGKKRMAVADLLRGLNPS
ncbi:MAG: methionyl-tRNA formyltransferase [Cytophagales bacterium]|nr:methionyl-tRNA formyltransferase [Cytophagales bacterium]